MQRLRNNLDIVVGILVSAIFSLGLIGYAITSTFARFSADDFCMGQTLVKYGLLGSQQWWYLNWDGRYSFTFLIHIFVQIGPEAARLVAPISLLILLLSLFSICYMLLSRFSKEGALRKLIFSFVPAAGISLLLLILSPRADESYYWLSGMATYFLPLVFWCLAAAIATYVLMRQSLRLKSWRGIASLVAFGITSFIAAGFAESFTVVALSLVGLIMLITYKLRQKRAFYLSTIATAVTTLGLIIMIAAPGNVIRKAATTPSEPILKALHDSFLSAAYFVAGGLADHALEYVLIGIVGYALVTKMLSARDFKLGSRIFTITSIVGYLLITASYLPSFYATSVAPPERVFIIPTFILLIMVLIYGAIARNYVENLKISQTKKAVNISLAALFVIALVVVPLGTARQLYRDRHAKVIYARQWDEIHKTLVAKRGSKVVVVQAPASSNRHELESWQTDPKHWINLCIEGYYSIDSFNVRF